MGKKLDENNKDEHKESFTERIKNFWKNSSVKRLIFISIILGILALAITIAPLYLADYLYGAGMLSRIPHNFSAEVWFTTFFSYIPATILGILSLYLSYQTVMKEREIERMKNRYRFIIKDCAELRMWEEQMGEIEGVSYIQISEKLYEINNDFNIRFNNMQNDLYLFCFSFQDTMQGGTQKMTIEKFEWDIKGKTEISLENQRPRFFISEGRFRNREYGGEIYFLLAKESEEGRAAAQCMYNGFRLTPGFSDSLIKLTAKLEDDGNRIYYLKFEFIMAAQKLKRNFLKSTNEFYSIDRQG